MDEHKSEKVLCRLNGQVLELSQLPVRAIMPEETGETLSRGIERQSVAIPQLSNEEQTFFKNLGIVFHSTDVSARGLSDSITETQNSRRVFRYRGQLVLETDRVFVKMSPGYFLKGVLEYLRELGLEYSSSLKFAPEIAVFKVVNNADPYALSLHLAEDARFKYVEPEFATVPHRNWSPTGISAYDNQWHLHNTGTAPDEVNSYNKVNPYKDLGIPAKVGADIDIQEAWELLVSGSSVNAGEGIRLAIMEWGFDNTHEALLAAIKEPDLAVKVILDTGKFGVNKLSKSVNHNSDHGTAVAGAALANINAVDAKIIGSAFDATFIPVQLGGLPDTTTFSYGIVYAANPGLLTGVAADFGGGADILSISIGLGYYSLQNQDVINKALEYAVTFGRKGKGMVILVAGPNAFTPVEDDYLPARPEVIGVGNSAQNDRYSGSGYGEVDIVAPGTAILTTEYTNSPETESPYSREGNVINNGNGPALPVMTGYRWNVSGTSISTPIVAGAIALLLQAQPNLNWREVKQLVLQSADQVDLDFNGLVEYIEAEDPSGGSVTVDLSWTTQKTGGDKLIDNHLNLVLEPLATSLLTPTTAGSDEPGSSTGIPYPLKHGTKFIKLTNQADSFTVGQSIILGFQTYLTETPVFTIPTPPTSLVVNSVARLKVGDQVAIGRGAVTYVSGNTYSEKTIYRSEPDVIPIWNPCGFKAGQWIRITGGYERGVPYPASNNPPQEIFEIKEIETRDQIQVSMIRLQTNRSREYSRGDKVELAYVAEATITAIDPATKTLTIQTTNPADYFSHFDVDTRVELINTEVRQVKEVFPGDPHYLRIDSILHDHPAGKPVQGGRTPLFSKAYGFGRLNAGRAVELAQGYFEDNHADLVIRDRLTAANIVDSPDVWVYNDDGLAPAPKPEDYEDYDYDVAGPHQQPLEEIQRKIFVRVGNRGTADNKEASVLVFLALTDAASSPSFTFPFETGLEHLNWASFWNKEERKQQIREGNQGIYLLGKQPILEGAIPASGDKTYELDWDKNDVPPPDLNMKAYLLVMISPFDGQEAALEITNNNNLSYKPIEIVRRIRFKKDLGTMENLPKVYELSNISPPASHLFHILIEDSSQTFKPKNIKIRVRLKNKNSPVQRLEFSYDGVNWTLDQTQPAWLQLSAESADPQFAGNDFFFSGSFDTAFGQKRLTFDVMVSDDAGEVLFEKSHTIRIRSEVDTNRDFEAQGGKFHFFTNTDNLSNTLAFGPLSHTEFRLSSIHANTGPAKALAICDGIVCVQPNTQGNLNLILKPIDQPPFNFAPISYFIYHNIDPASLLYSGKVAAATKNQLTKRVWDSQDQANESRRNKEIRLDMPITPDEDATEKALGFHFWYNVASPDPVKERYQDTEPIDNLFYRPSDTIQLPLVRGGWDIGEFIAGNFGLTVVLADTHYRPTLDVARGMDYVLQAPALGAGSVAATLENRWQRETVLHFMDPAAFFGTFFPFRLFVKDTGADSIIETSDYDKLKKNNVYDQCLSLFQNKNKVYLSILNEYRFSYNFFGNYQDNLRVASGGNYTDLNYYGAEHWPILILEAAHFGENGGGSKNVLRFQLPVATAPGISTPENPAPLLYLAQGFWNHLLFPFKDIKSKKKFMPMEAGTVTGYTTEAVELAVPNYSAGGQMKPVASAIRLLYLKRAEAAPTVSSGITLRSQNPLDHLFCPLDLAALVELMPAATHRSVMFEDEVYVDGGQSANLQMDFIAKTGLALTNQHVTFFAYAYDVREKAKASRSFGLVGANTNSSDDLLNEISNRHDNIELFKGNLVVNGDLQPYLLLKDASNGFSGFEKVDPKELLPIIISIPEFLAMKDLIEDPANFSNRFPVFLGVRKVPTLSQIHQVDDNGEAYTILELVLRGYLWAGSEYQINEVGTSIQIYSYGNF